MIENDKKVCNIFLLLFYFSLPKIPNQGYSGTVGLTNDWKRNVMHCIETVKMSILWNGKRLEGFQPTRGIRMLFLLIRLLVAWSVWVI